MILFFLKQYLKLQTLLIDRLIGISKLHPPKLISSFAFFIQNEVFKISLWDLHKAIGEISDTTVSHSVHTLFLQFNLAQVRMTLFCRKKSLSVTRS